MTIDLEQFGNKLTKEYQKTVDFFHGLPDHVWEEKLYADGEEWTVHEVFAHIVEVEGSFLRLFTNIAEGGTGVGVDFDIDRYNSREVRKIRDKTREDLFLLFEKRRAIMIDFVRSLSPVVLSNQGSHPFLGKTTLYEMMRLYVLHINIHIRDIRKIV